MYRTIKYSTEGLFETWDRKQICSEASVNGCTVLSENLTVITFKAHDLMQVTRAKAFEFRRNTDLIVLFSKTHVWTALISDI
jgi:hypothetical protein